MKHIVKKGVCLFVASLIACSAFAADEQQAPASADQQQVSAANSAAPASANAYSKKKGKKGTKEAEAASQQSE